MIKEKFITFIMPVSQQALKHYKSYGYKVEYRKEVTVDVKHLYRTSKVKITAICSNCKREVILSYRKYLKNISNKHYPHYVCSKCLHTISLPASILAIYGVDNVFKSEEIKTRIGDKMEEHYGVRHALQSSEIEAKRKKTYIRHFGVDNPQKSSKIREKRYLTNIKRYGTKYPQQTQAVKDKMLATNIKKYNGNCYMADPILRKLALGKGSSLKEHKCGITYQGSYEKEFLDLYSEEIFIERGKVFKYSYDNKLKTYFSDFYIPALNLIVEIKSSRWYNKAPEKVKQKGLAVLKNNYKFILIMDKNYTEFNKILKDLDK